MGADRTAYVEGEGDRVEQRLTMVSLGVADVGVAARFYGEGLGWEQSPASAGDFVLFVLRGGLGLALYPRESLAAEAGLADPGGFGGVTLAHNVESAAEVDEVLRKAVSAGATVTALASEKPWGYTGYFADPDGHPWEVAFVPSLPLRGGMLES
jgi:catechol 2,3-dioxygenase-like lactoylglutathione lyase family enzyme